MVLPQINLFTLYLNYVLKVVHFFTYIHLGLKLIFSSYMPCISGNIVQVPYFPVAAHATEQYEIKSIFSYCLPCKAENVRGLKSLIHRIATMLDIHGYSIKQLLSR